MSNKETKELRDRELIAKKIERVANKLRRIVNKLEKVEREMSEFKVKRSYK